MRVAVLGTHPKQFNGYSKVVYELCKAMTVGHPDVEMHVFGFQNFYNHPGHRNDVPPAVKMYDAAADEVPRQAGFGIHLIKAYVARVRPDVVVVFNDLSVLTAALNELKDAPNRSEFKVVAYVDQVYLCQKKQFIQKLNELADAAIAFTPEWKDCILGQGLTLPCHVLPHGINTRTYFPVPKALARRFYNMPQDDFLVLNLNRNQPRKRWDVCLQAFAEVVRRLPDAPIKLVVGTEINGSWDIKALFERELVKRGVPVEAGMKRLVIPGHPQQLTDDETNVLYNIADVGINTCDGEGFGLCNFEQAAIGIPQVVPRIGGFLHFFEPSFTALVEPRISLYVDAFRDDVGGEAQISAPEDYADAIVRYYTDRATLTQHGELGRKSITARFGWDKIADMFRSILRDVRPVEPPPALALALALAPAPPPAQRDENLSVDDAMRLLGVLPLHPACVVVPSPHAHATSTSNPKKKKKKKCKMPSVEEMDEIRKLRDRIEKLLGGDGGGGADGCSSSSSSSDSDNDNDCGSKQ